MSKPDYMQVINEIATEMIHAGRIDDAQKFRDKCAESKAVQEYQNEHSVRLIANRYFGIKPKMQKLPGTPAKFRY